MAKHKYEGWVLVLTLIGSLSVVAAIALAYGLVPSADLVLSEGEWEILAVVLYVFAIVIYLFGGQGSSERAVAAPLFISAGKKSVGWRGRGRRRVGHDQLSR